LPQDFIYYTIDYYRIIVGIIAIVQQNVMLMKTNLTQKIEIKQAKAMTKQTNKPKT
jgi:hypothetical protein